MIIDANVNVENRRYTVEKALSGLSAAKVSQAVIFADPRSSDLAAQNTYVLLAAQRHDLFPFWYVGGNPFTDTRPDEFYVPDNLSDYAGIRWHRWIGKGIDREGKLDEDELAWAVNLMESAEFEALAAAAAHYRLPIMFEESLAVSLELVLRFPSLDIIIPHLGARNGGQANVLRALWDHPNVYFDTSLAQLDETVLARVGTERILYGSGFPYGDPDAELDKIDRLPVAEDAKEGMYGDNLAHLLSNYVPA